MPGRDDIEDDGFGETSRYTAHLDRGWSLLDRGDVQQARSSANQAHRLRPDVPDAAMLMAAIALAEGEPESALEWYDKAIEVDGEYVEAQLGAAQVLLYDLDEPQRAIERAEQARELDECMPIDRLDLGLLEIEALVALHEDERATAQLASLTDLGLIEELFDPQTSRERNSEILATLGWLGDPGEAEELEVPFGRHVQVAVRVAQIHVDLGRPRDALPWLHGLLHRLEDDPELWYLYNEAAFLAAEPVSAAHAALQVLRLDSEAPMPEWAPEPVALHQQVVDLLHECPDPELARLAGHPEFVVFINDRPPPELVLEGVDPRVRVLALAARGLPLDPTGEEFDPPALTGVAVYRRALIRGARDLEQFREELRFSLYEELASFLGIDDSRRSVLGLPERIGFAGVDVASAMPIELPAGRRGAKRAAAAASEGSGEAATSEAPVKRARKGGGVRKKAGKKAGKKKPK
ncbi:tetratricopeptide repeat protein [Nannocystaceae bacterium ST9]